MICEAQQVCHFLQQTIFQTGSFLWAAHTSPIECDVGIDNDGTLKFVGGCPPVQKCWFTYPSTNESNHYGAPVFINDGEGKGWCIYFHSRCIRFRCSIRPLTVNKKSLTQSYEMSRSHLVLCFPRRTWFGPKSLWCLLPNDPIVCFHWTFLGKWNPSLFHVSYWTRGKLATS
jgi:hypothetical protein